MNEEPGKDPPLFSFFNEVGIIEQLARNSFERVLPDGLTLSQFSVLSHFVRLGVEEKNPVELARAFQVTKGAMTNTVKRLSAKGLVEVTPDPRDGRGKRVRITARGRRVREECLAAAAPLLWELEREFGKQEFEAALPFLRRLRAFLDRARD